MKMKELKIWLDELFEQNDSKEILEVLKIVLKKKSRKSTILKNLKREHNDYLDTKMQGVISFEEDRKWKAGLATKLQQYYQNLEKSDLNSLTIPKLKARLNRFKGITNQILVHTQTDQIQDVQEFFKLLDYSNVEVKAYSEEVTGFDDYDIVVFDNRDLPKPSKPSNIKDKKGQKLIHRRIQMLEEVKENTGCYIIHFGEYLPWVSENRNRVQAANSRFSLHARVTEVIDFINSYRV